MQGFILHTQRIRDGDSIVYILSPKTLLKTYRFYGLRYSSALSGYKIDSALEENSSFLSHLRDMLHLGFSWILDREKILLWQEFIRLLYGRLKEVSELDSSYFDLLDKYARHFLKQNPKRVILDAYMRILKFEGRLHKDFICFACDEEIRGNITLLRAFLPLHDSCAFSYEFPHQKLEIFYEKKNCSIFNDEEIHKPYELVKQSL